MDDLTALAAHLRRAGLAGGLDAVGFAPATAFADVQATLEERKAAGLHGGMQFTYRNPARSTDPSRAVPGARVLVVGARSYRRAHPDAAVGESAGAKAHPGEAHPGDGRSAVVAEVARYSWVDHYAPLRAALEGVAARLREAGWHARVLCDDNALVDREAAFRAGLGWYGKNTMLLLHGHGSEFVLGSVVTDAPLPTRADEATGASRATPEDAAAAGCGSCSRCLPACPTGALVEPGVLDARRCLAWLLQAEGVFPREHRIALGRRIYGCDACQDACPPNRLEIRRRPLPPAEEGAEATVEILELLALDDDELLRRYGRWYLPRREPRYLRRNALVALGNVGRGDDHAVVAAVSDQLRADDPIVRAHAVWTAARLGRHDLLTGMAAAEQDETVRAELGALPPPRQA